MTLDVDAGAEVVMRGQGVSTTLALRDATISIGLCEAAWNGDPFRVQRDGENVVITTQLESRMCRISGLPGPVSLTLQLNADTTFRTLRLSRDLL